MREVYKYQYGNYLQTISNNTCPLLIHPQTSRVLLLIALLRTCCYWLFHYSDVIMDTISSQITSLAIVYSMVYSGADQRKHQSSASLTFVRGIHRGPVKHRHKWPVTRKMFPFDDVIIYWNNRYPDCYDNYCYNCYYHWYYWYYCGYDHYIHLIIGS